MANNFRLREPFNTYEPLESFYTRLNECNNRETTENHRIYKMPDCQDYVQHHFGNRSITGILLNLSSQGRPQ